MIVLINNTTSAPPAVQSTHVPCGHTHPMNPPPTRPITVEKRPFRPIRFTYPYLDHISSSRSPIGCKPAPQHRGSPSPPTHQRSQHRASHQNPRVKDLKNVPKSTQPSSRPHQPSQLDVYRAQSDRDVSGHSSQTGPQKK